MPDNSVVRDESYLGEKCVEAVNLLSFFNKSIILRDTHKCELIHEIDNVGLTEMSILKSLHSDRECSGKHQKLTILWQKLNQFL